MESLATICSKGTHSMKENRTNLPPEATENSPEKGLSTPESPAAPGETKANAPGEALPALPENAAGLPRNGEDKEAIRAFAQELAAAITDAQTPPEPTPEEKAAAELAAKKARKLKARRRRRKALRGLLLRTLVLLVVLYLLFFQLIGVTTMPSGDMYPRIDSGDLLLFYRLDKDARAQDIIVFEKDRAALQEYAEPENADPTPAPQTSAPSATDPASAAQTAGQPTAAPQATSQVPDSVQHLTPAQIVQDNSLMGKINRFVYNAEVKLGLRRPDGKQTFVCRVVAVAGDTVEVTDDGRLIVNGNTMIESNIFSQTTPYLGFTQYPLTLHAGECFVMADLRNGGADSRFFGPVTTEEILGTVITIVRRNNL